MDRKIEFTVVVESYNLTEAATRDQFRRALGAARAIVAEEKGAEMLVPDVGMGEEMTAVLAREFPEARRIDVSGLDYDQAKMAAARAASGRYVLYLDSDCIPQPDWHRRMLEPLRSGRALACGGYTRYEGRFMAKIMSVMDFGFFYPRTSRALQCYSSNNCAFVRETLVEVPVPEVDMRCGCYAHTQRLNRRGVAMLLVPDAVVFHGMVPIVRERTIRGYGIIAACWENPELPEARWLKAGVLSLPLFYAENVLLDWKRIFIGHRDLELAFWQMFLALPLFPLLRLIDAVGMIRALALGPVKGGWGGYRIFSWTKRLYSAVQAKDGGRHDPRIPSY